MSLQRKVAEWMDNQWDGMCIDDWMKMAQDLLDHIGFNPPVINVGPSETLVFTMMDENLTAEQYMDMVELLKHAFPDNRCVVLSRCQITAIKNEGVSSVEEK